MIDGLAELSAILPLPDRRARISGSLARAHRSVLDGFLHSGRPGHADPDEAAALAAMDLVVLDGAGRVNGAYPFTTNDTGHRLRIGGVTTHAMCSLDALAVAPVFGVEATIESRCARTETDVLVRMAGSEVQTAPPDLHVGIRWQAVVACAANSLCADMVFLRDRTAAEEWRGPDPDAAGVYDLGRALALAVAFFDPVVNGPPVG